MLKRIIQNVEIFLIFFLTAKWYDFTLKNKKLTLVLSWKKNRGRAGYVFQMPFLSEKTS